MSYNETLNTAIDRLEDALEDARSLPGWAVGLVVIVSLLCAIILLHVLALMSLAPCLWAMYKQRKQERERLIQAAADDGEMEILEPPPDSALDK